MLVSHFLKNKVSSRTGKPFRVTRQVMAVFQAHHWPGNVRELENAVERACALCEGDVIQLADLPPNLQAYAAQVAEGEEIDTRISSTEAAGAAPTVLAATTPGGAAAPKVTGLVSAPPTAESLKAFLRAQELSHINRTLAVTGGDKEKAAAMLGISLATLYRKLVEDEAA